MRSYLIRLCYIMHASVFMCMSKYSVCWTKVNRLLYGWNTEENRNTKIVNKIFENRKKWLPNKLENVTKINKNGVHFEKKNQSLLRLTSANSQHRNNNFRNFVCSFVLLPLPLCASSLSDLSHWNIVMLCYSFIMTSHCWPVFRFISHIFLLYLSVSSFLSLALALTLYIFRYIFIFLLDYLCRCQNELSTK